MINQRGLSGRTILLHLVSIKEYELSKNKRATTSSSSRFESRLADLCSVLVRNGADVTVKDNEGLTALHIASGNLYFNPCAALAHNNPSINDADNNGATALHILFFTGKNESRPLSLSQGVVLGSDFGEAAQRDAICRLLIAHKADLNAKDSIGNSPLHRAMQVGNARVSEILLRKGADKNAVNSNRQTPMHIACQVNIRYCGDNNETLEILMRHRARTKSHDIYGNQPLHYACSSGADLSILKLNSEEIGALNSSGWGPLHIACFFNNYEGALTLLRESAIEVNAPIVRL